MSVHCRHGGKNQSTAPEEMKLKKNGYTHMIDSNFAPEKRFEPWSLSTLSKTRTSSPNNRTINQRSSLEPSDTPSASRNYGWDEIEQSEENAERLRQLLPLWDAERIAILKLQHDLDKNIFKRTVDYVKRIGQSIGLALWLWVHRPANCSNISNLYQQQQCFFPTTNDDKLYNVACAPCSDTMTYPALGNNDNPDKQDFLIPSIDTLPDSLWLKRFVLNEPQEYLPPIARAMKNMLDNDMFVCNSEIQEDNVWPHFINQYRITQNKSFPRDMQGNNAHQLPVAQKLSPSSQDTTAQKKSEIKVVQTSNPRSADHWSHKPKSTVIQLNTITSVPPKQQQNMTTTSPPLDKQLLLTPALESFLKEDQKKSKKERQKSRKEGPSKTDDKTINIDKEQHQSKLKRRTSRKSSKPKRQRSRRRSKSKRRRSKPKRHQSKSKRSKSHRRSKSKKQSSSRRSKSKRRKSSRRSKSRRRRKHLSSRTTK